MQRSASLRKTEQQFACAAPFWAALVLPAAENFAQTSKNSSRRAILLNCISAGAKHRMAGRERFDNNKLELFHKLTNNSASFLSSPSAQGALSC
jgi:hypothetical protein